MFLLAHWRSIELSDWLKQLQIINDTYQELYLFLRQVLSLLFACYNLQSRNISFRCLEASFEVKCYHCVFLCCHISIWTFKVYFWLDGSKPLSRDILNIISVGEAGTVTEDYIRTIGHGQVITVAFHRESFTATLVIHEWIFKKCIISQPFLFCRK